MRATAKNQQKSASLVALMVDSTVPAAKKSNKATAAANQSKKAKKAESTKAATTAKVKMKEKAPAVTTPAKFETERQLREFLRAMFTARIARTDKEYQSELSSNGRVGRVLLSNTAAVLSTLQNACKVVSEKAGKFTFAASFGKVFLDTATAELKISMGK